MKCEMCGKETNLVRARIEGAEMTVCEKCSRFGTVTGRVVSTERKVYAKART